MKIFISYGHDSNAEFVMRLTSSIRSLGHDVWIDRNEIRSGDAWRKSIVEGIRSSDLMLSFLSTHSIRNPGVCRDEIRIALGMKGNIIRTVLLEPGIEKEIPVHISHIQWLDLSDWKREQSNQLWFDEKMNMLKAVIENPELINQKSELNYLKEKLKPTSFVYDQFQDSKKTDLYTKRNWIEVAIKNWETNGKSKLFWMLGGPGSGKTSFIVDLVANNQHKVFGVNFCEYGSDERNAPDRILRTIAFQIASRIPHYRSYLKSKLEHEELESKNAIDLRALLFKNAFSECHLGDYESCFVVIDALDEALASGHESLISNLNFLIKESPHWLRFLITSRPESKILQELSDFEPMRIDLDSKENQADSEFFIAKHLERLKIELSDGILTSIYNASGGNYLYLDLFFSGNISKEEILERLTQETLPKGLNGFYYSNFRKIFKESNSSSWNQIESVLSLLVAASSDVPEEIINYVLGSARGLKAIKSNLRSYLKVSDDRRIGFFHKSIRDWLCSPENIEFSLEVNFAAKDLVTLIWNSLRGQADLTTDTVASFYVSDLEDLLINLSKDKKKIELDLAENECKTFVANIKNMLSKSSHDAKFRFVHSIVTLLINSKIPDRPRAKLATLILHEIPSFHVNNVGEMLVSQIIFKNAFLAESELKLLCSSRIFYLILELFKSDFCHDFYEFLKSAVTVPEDRANINYYISTLIENNSDFDRYLTSCENNLTESQTIGDLSLIRRATIALSNAYHHLKNLEKVTEIWREYLKFSKEVFSIEEVLFAMDRLAISYKEIGQFENAIATYEEAFIFAKNNSDSYNEIQSLNRLARLYQEIKKDDKAISLYQEAIEIAKKSLNHNYVIQAMNTLSWTYESLGQNESALSLNEEAVNYAKGNLKPLDAIMAMDRLSRTYEITHQHDKAIAICEEVLALAKNSTDYFYVIQTINKLSRLYREGGKSEKAISLNKEAIEIAKESLNPQYVIQALNQLSQNYQELGQNENALALDQEILNLAKKNASPFEILAAINKLASRFKKLGKVHEAIDISKEGLNYAHRFLGPNEFLSQIQKLIDLNEAAGEIEAAISLANEGLKYSIERTNSEIVVDQMLKLANILGKSGRANKALALGEEAANLAKQELRENEVFKNLSRISELYLDIGQYNAAINLTTDWRQIARDLFNQDQVTKATDRLIRTFLIAGNYREAISLNCESLALAKEKSDPNQIIGSMSTLMYAYLRNGQLEDAISLNKERFQISLEHSKTYELFLSWSHHAILTCLIGEKEIAKNLILEAIEFAQSNLSIINLGNAFLDLCETHLEPLDKTKILQRIRIENESQDGKSNLAKGIYLIFEKISST